MSVEDLVKDAVTLGVSATEYVLKFESIRDKLIEQEPGEDVKLIDSQARTRTKNYFVAYNKGIKDTVDVIVGQGYQIK